MLRDSEENEVVLSEKPNAHLLILGRSGSGKTYFLCRKLEEELDKSKKIVVFDYSESYSLAELNKAKFRYMKMVKIFKPFELNMNCIFRGKNLQRELIAALIKSLGIQSYYQKKLLSEAIKQVFVHKGFFSIPLLMEQLEKLYTTKENAEEDKNILHLLSRLEPYSEIDGIQISDSKRKETVYEDNKAGIVVIQLSNYPQIQRKFLVEFLAEVFWSEMRCGNKKADIVLFDEFQNVTLKPGSALSTMLREGRKFGLAVYLSSQFLGNYDKETVDTLMQAGNMIFFRPTAHDKKLIANIIDIEQSRDWQSILDKLQVGEAVVKGRFSLNGSSKEIEKPLIFRVQEGQKNEA